MFGLKKSTIKAAAGYQIYDIPHTDKTKIATHEDGDYVTVIGECRKDVWFCLCSIAKICSVLIVLSNFFN